MPDEPTPTEGGKQETEAPKAEGRTFTQEELDRVVGDRLARERQKYGDYDALKQKAGRLDQLEESQRTELEKAQKRADKAEHERDAAVTRATHHLRASAIMSEASKQNALDPEAVVALLPHDSVTVGDDGQVAGVEEAVSGLLKSKPYLVGSTHSPGPGDGGARAPAPSGDAAADHNQLISTLFGG